MVDRYLVIERCVQCANNIMKDDHHFCMSQNQFTGLCSDEIPDWCPLPKMPDMQAGGIVANNTVIFAVHNPEVGATLCIKCGKPMLVEQLGLRCKSCGHYITYGQIEKSKPKKTCFGYYDDGADECETCFDGDACIKKGAV